MEAGELLVRGTACAAFLLYVVALLKRRLSWWAAGCVLFWVHVACAFQWVHHWSHNAAFEETAKQTLAATGFNSGFGLYLNYAFMLVWAGDALWWSHMREAYFSRSKVIASLIHGFMAFMWFNATIVFGHGFARWLGVAALAWLGFTWMRQVWHPGRRRG